MWSSEREGHQRVVRFSERSFDLLDLASSFTDIILCRIRVNREIYNISRRRLTRIDKTLDDKLIPSAIVIDPVRRFLGEKLALNYGYIRVFIRKGCPIVV